MSTTEASAVIHSGVTIGEAPAWADVQPFARPQAMAADLVEQGLCFWLVDDAANLLGPEQVNFSRMVKEVVAQGGLQGAATFDVDFDPSFQRLAIHHVRVVRGAEVRELASPEHFEVFRRERDLERAHYDGRLTVHLILPDLRVGDIVDTAYSVTGANPVQAGRFCCHVRFQWGVPVARTRFRLISERRRKLNMRYWGERPRFDEQPLPKDGLQRTWIADGFRPFQPEADTPSWWTGFSKLLITDAMAWSEVADAFRAAYEPPQALPPELEAAVARIAAERPKEEGRVAAALKLVQRDVRYLAMSIGDGGFVPRPVQAIWETRFGDCKDASRLLVSLLRRLGVKAEPVLVNTQIGRDLHDGPAHLFAFDHCIVRARLGGESFWLDPTMDEQGGRLKSLFQPRFGWALPLTERADLVWMGEDPSETIFEETERFVFGPKRRSPAELEVRAVSRAWRADGLRRQIRNEGLVGVARRHHEYYEGRYGPLKVLRSFEAQDNDADNEIQTLAAYEVAEPWSVSENGAQAQFQALNDAIRPQLTTPASHARRAPIDLGLPRKIVQQTVLELPIRWNAQEWNERWEVGGLQAQCRLRQESGGKRLVLSSTLEVRERELPARLAEKFFSVADKVIGSAGVTLNHGLHRGEFGKAKVSPLRWVLRWIWIILILGAFAARAVSELLHAQNLAPP